MATAFRDLKLANIDCALEDGIGWIRLNRAPVNAIDLALLEALVEAIRTARNDPEVKVAMLASRMAGYFSAGLDLKELELSSDLGRAELLDQLFKDGVIRAMRTARKIFIAVVNGHCLGGGLELALAADFRIGIQGKWQIGLPEAKLGGMPGGGGLQTLRRLVGTHRTLRLSALGETFDVTRAHELGILDELHADDSQISGFVQKFAQGPGHAIGAIKLALYEGEDMALADALVMEHQLYRAIMMGDDIKEGVAAFREKRPAKFKGI